MAAAMEVAQAVAVAEPPAESREIQHARMLLQDRYPEIQLNESVWLDLEDFLVQHQLLHNHIAQLQAT